LPGPEDAPAAVRHSGIPGMTTYTKRDLRAADALALILVGLGFFSLLFAAMPLLDGRSVKGAAPAAWVLGGLCLVLGAALNLKIRQLVRNQGREPEDYPGVPD